MGTKTGFQATCPEDSYKQKQENYFEEKTKTGKKKGERA